MFLFTSIIASASEPAPAEASKDPIPIQRPKRASGVDFERDVRPILNRNCLPCHNRTTSKADLILETPQDMIKGGESGKAIQPGRGAESLLIKLAAHQKKPFMPPRDNKAAAANLLPEELGLVKAWIDQGAKGSVQTVRPIQWIPLPEGLNAIYSVALTPDGQFGACSRANQIFLHHIPSGQEVGRLTDPQLVKLDLNARPGAAHRDMVYSLAFSPDGEWLASGSFREVKLWRRPANPPASVIPNAAQGAIQTMTVSTDGQWMAVVGSEPTIRLWNLQTRKLVRTFPDALGKKVILRFSMDGRYLAAGSTDYGLRIWSISDGKLWASQPSVLHPLSLAWLGVGLIATAGKEGDVRTWKVPEAVRGQLVEGAKLSGHQGAVTALEPANGEGNRLLSGGADGTVRLWDVEKARTLREFKHGGPVSAIAVRPDGRRIASAGLNNVAKLWDASNGQAVAELKGNSHLNERVAVLERQLALANAEITYRKGAWQGATNQQQTQVARVKKATETQTAADKAFDEKKKTFDEAFAAKESADKDLDTANTELKKGTDALEAAEKAVKENAGTPDRAKAANESKAGAEKVVNQLKEKQKKAMEKASAASKPVTDSDTALKKAIQAKSTADHEMELAKAASEKANNDVADAEKAIQLADGSLKKSDGDLQAARKAATEAEKPIRTLSFAPDNISLATAGDDRLVHTWSAETGVPFDVLGEADAVPHGAKTVPASPRNEIQPMAAFVAVSLLASAGQDGAILLWDLNPAWKFERTIGGSPPTGEVPFVDRINALRFSPDGRLLATGGGEPTRGGEIKIWEVASGKLAQDLKNIHSDAVLGLDFSPDGKFLASSASDRFVRVIELATGKIAKSFEGHTHHVLGISWKQDGRTLASAGADAVVKTWDFISGERKKNIAGFDKEVTSIQFIGNTDQAVVTCGDGQVATVNDQGNRVKNFPGSNDFMYSAAATPDGKIIIGGGRDGLLRVWNGPSGLSITNFAAPRAATR